MRRDFQQSFAYSGFGLGGGGGFWSWLSGFAEEGPEDGQQRDQRDEDLRAYAIEAPDFELVGFDVGEVEGVAESQQRCDEGEDAAAEKGEEGEGAISDDADGGDGNRADHGVAAMVDDAAVPARVDVAGLDGVGVVNLERENRDDDAENGKSRNDITHDGVFLRAGAGDDCARSPSIFQCIESGLRAQGSGLRAQGLGIRDLPIRQS